MLVWTSLRASARQPAASLRSVSPQKYYAEEGSRQGTDLRLWRAITKSDAATTKQLDQLAVKFATAIYGVTTLLNDLNERVTKVEASK